MHPISSLPSTSFAGTRAGTRGEGDSEVTPVSVSEPTIASMDIEKAVLDWMHTELKAGSNNSKKGKPFYLKTQQQSFTIVPIYQGIASYYWELWMNVGGVNVPVWSKYKDITYYASSTSTTPETLTDQGVPDGAFKVHAPTYTYTATADKALYFFLKVWKKDEKTKDTPDMIVTSLDKKMLALEGAKRPEGVPADNDVTIIGCEDGTDNDYEDLVFLVYGKPTPPIVPTDEIEITETKRYMMEDLGTTDDFDFNDVVVDVENVYTQKIHLKQIANGGWDEDYREDPVFKGQRAIVRAAGGIYDFTLTIGNKTWSKSDDLTADQMYNTGWGNSTIYRTGMESELAKFDVTGWNPDKNNISVTVVGKGPNDGVKTITFPKQGEAPLMIAVDKDVNWMTEERSSVPSSWWYKVD